jgi:ribonuclease BN (tRNA processing enzyme)
VRLIVLGAGPAYTDREGASGAAYLVEDGQTRLLLDLGQGSFPRIFPHVPPADLDAIVVSHLHPDHFIDLVALRHFLRYEFKPPRRMRVLGPLALAARLDALHAEPGFAAQSLDIEPLGGLPHEIGRLTIEAGLVTHTDESYAVRVTSGAAGPALVYSGDCGRADDIAPLLRQGDVLLTEVAFGPGPVPTGALHLDGPAVGRLAARTAAGRVLLTHIQMGFDPDVTIASVRAEYDGPVTFVWPGSVADIT